MKTITLHGAAVRNDGRYADAGSVMTVGDAGDQISAARATELVEQLRAAPGEKGVAAKD